MGDPVARKKITQLTAHAAPALTDILPIVDLSGTATTKKSTITQVLSPLVSASYAVTWTAVSVNPAIGDGTLVGLFLQVGKVVDFSITMIAGSTTTFGTGAWIFTLPVVSLAMTVSRPVFQAYAQTAGGVPFMGLARASNTTTFRVVAEGSVYFDFDSPFVWASGDFFNVFGRYWAA